MFRKLLFSIIGLLLLIAGCNNLTFHDDDEVAAIVRDEEITVGELRFLYSDDWAREYLDWMITVTLVKQEVEAMDLDLSPYLSREEADWFESLPPPNTKDEGGQQIRTFAESQAKNLI